MLASVIHAHGAPSTVPPAARLEAVLSDLVSRNAHASPAALDAASSHAGTPLSSSPSPLPGDASALRVSAGLALGVAGSATPSPERGRAGGAESERARQSQEELRRLVAVLHNTQQRDTAAALGEACRSIQLMVESNPDAKQCAAPAPRGARNCSQHCSRAKRVWC